MKKIYADLLSTRIRLFREYLGMTKEEFANKIKCSVSAINSWEHGRCRPTNPCLSRIYLWATKSDFDLGI